MSATRCRCRQRSYYSNLSQRTYNGNAADVAALRRRRRHAVPQRRLAADDAGGAAIPNFLNPGLFPGVDAFRRGGPYSQLDQTATDSNGYGATVQATWNAGAVRPAQPAAGRAQL